jgi:nickel transport protein
MTRSLFFATFMVASSAVLAHGAGYQRVTDAEPVTLGFDYGFGEPMAGVELRLSAPDGSIWQRAHTDARGRFSFAPDRPGRWVAEVDDGLGHQVRADIRVGADGAIDAAGEHRPLHLPAGLLLVLLVASLIANALLLVTMRRRGAAA